MADLTGQALLHYKPQENRNYYYGTHQLDLRDKYKTGDISKLPLILQRQINLNNMTTKAKGGSFSNMARAPQGINRQRELALQYMIIQKSLTVEGNLHYY
tara:strand:+ start:201 stop:500 length:300 start_codon:yes stop_codon:yes gene_type:complete